MTTYRPTDDDVSMAEWLADDVPQQPDTQQPATQHSATPATAPASVQVYRHDPPYAHGPVLSEQEPVLSEDDGYSQDRQRERFGGLNWGAGFFGWLVAAGLVVVLSSLVGGVVAALGMTDEVLSADAEGGTAATAIATAATLSGALLVAYYAGGYVAGRMSRFDGGKQGVAVWLIGVLCGGIGVGLGLLADARYGIFDQVRLPTLPLPTGVAPLSGVITALAALLALLLAAVVGGKVGCRYHRKVDDAAYP